MATKDINFDIKVNGKQLDLAKISFKDFDKVVKEAKKDLQALPLNDPRYKVLNAEIKAADKAWKEARKSVGDFDKELKDGEDDVKSYRAQIAELTKAQVALEEQGKENSQQYADNEKKIKSLRDAQERLVRSTQDLDDTLAQIPGPIGMIGQGLQTFESVSQNATSAFKSLGLGFKGFDQILKTSLVGFLVGLLVTLVAAVMNAAKSFKPLQMAFASIQDAVGSLFNALKPITDFILNVFVGALNLVAGAINSVASAFGGVNNGANQMTLTLEREIAKQERLFGNFSNSVGEETQKVLDSFTEYKKALLEVSKALVEKTITDKEALDQQLLIELNYISKLKQLRDEFESKRAIDTINHESKIENIRLIGLDNERKNQLQTIENSTKTESLLLANQIVSYKNRKKSLEDNLNTINKIDIDGKQELIDALKTSIKEEEYLIDLKMSEMQDNLRQGNAEEQKLKRQFFREDTAAIIERNNQILQSTTELIKEENARNLEAAKDALVILKEQHRKEREEVRLAGGTTLKLKEKQAAEEKVLLEKKRLAQVQFDSYIIQLEIDRNNRLVIEAGKGTQEYFDARRNIIDKELQQELLLADGNANKVENARTNHWKKLLELDKEGLNNQLDVLNKQLEAEYDNSQSYFNKQRDIEVKNYELQQKEYQLNFDMLEVLKKEHTKRMNMIDVAQLNNASDYFSRRAETEKKQYGQMFQDLEIAEDFSYKARLKAAGDNATEIEIIEREHTQNLKDLQNQKIQAYAGVATAMMDSLANLTSAIGAFYEFESQNTENSMEDRKKAFEQNKKYQIATAALAAASGIIQILAQPSTLPSPFDWIVKIANAAALGIMTAVQISKIKSTEFNASGGSGGKQQGNTLGRNYGDGGMIDGPSHKSAAGGVMINAEGGEAVMTRGAVSMFGPMLSAMNQYGGGASFMPGAAGSSRFDNPSVQNVAQDRQPLVMKTYVVSSDMKSEMEKQARLKDLSTL